MLGLFVTAVTLISTLSLAVAIGQYRSLRRLRDTFVPRNFDVGGGLGNAINWFTYPTRVVGWKSSKPRVGDMLRSKLKSGRTGVFVFKTVEAQRDPDDMFFATVQACGYLDVEVP